MLGKNINEGKYPKLCQEITMNLKMYLKEKGSFLSINILLFIGFSLLLFALNVPIGNFIIIGSVWFFPLGSYMLLEYLRLRKFFNEAYQTIEALEQKYLLCEVIEKPEFLEGQLIYELLNEANKNMHEAVNKEHQIQVDYREYIEAWVHEIKTPMASMGLIMRNEDTPTMRKLAYEIRRVENYVEQVLYYARSSNASKDYLIKSFKLKECVVEVVKNYRSDFIKKKIQLILGELEEEVYSDKKWVSFILGQILGNAIKYSKEEEARIEITSRVEKNCIQLTLADNGVGINEKDKSRVFDKGFTGENGRIFGKSTGIGLYISRNLCEQLGLGISLKSEKGKGTQVTLTFPLDEELV